MLSLMPMKKATDPQFEQVWHLYETSFPGYELRTKPDHIRAMEQAEDYHVELVMQEDQLVGFVMYWQTQDYLYLEHFALLPSMRNKGYGSQVLELLKQKGQRIILEIDPPEDEISQRRRGFYQRCGFVVNPYDYIHIPYRKEDVGHPLVLMTWPEGINQTQYQEFYDFMRYHVAQYAEVPPQKGEE